MPYFIQYRLVDNRDVIGGVDSKASQTVFQTRDWEILAYILAPNPRFYLSRSSNTFLRYICYPEWTGQLIISSSAITAFLEKIAALDITQRLEDRLQPDAMVKYLEACKGIDQKDVHIDRKHIHQELEGLINCYRQAAKEQKEIEIIG